MASLGIVIHVPHASRVIPAGAREHIVLGDSELTHELDVMTDAYMDLLAQAALERTDVTAQVVVAPVSRLVVDVERFTDGTETMESVGMGPIYMRTSDQRVLREHRDASLLDQWFHPHAAAVASAVESALAAHDRVLIVDLHSYPTERQPYEITDARAPRPPVCLGTDSFHTPPDLVQVAQEVFGPLGVGLESPFEGTYVPLARYGTEPRVSSIMVEIRRDGYMKEHGGEIHDGFDTLADALAGFLTTFHTAVLTQA